MNKSIFATIGFLIVISSFTSSKDTTSNPKLSTDTPTVKITNTIRTDAIDSLTETKKKLDKSLSEAIKVTNDLQQSTENVIKQSHIIEDLVKDKDTLPNALLDTTKVVEKVFDDSVKVKKETQFNRLLKKLGL